MVSVPFPQDASRDVVRVTVRASMSTSPDWIVGPCSAAVMYWILIFSASPNTAAATARQRSMSKPMLRPESSSEPKPGTLFRLAHITSSRARTSFSRVSPVSVGSVETEVPASTPAMRFSSSATRARAAVAVALALSNSACESSPVQAITAISPKTSRAMAILDLDIDGSLNVTAARIPGRRLSKGDSCRRAGC